MKPYPLYAALTAALNDYNDRHYLSRDYMADVLGYRGNAAQQLSNALNPNNIDKVLSDHRKSLMLNAFDDTARMVFFTEWMRQWGMRPSKMSAPAKCDIVSFNVIIDDAQIEADESFRTAKMAVRDETLTRDELEAILKEATEAMMKQEEIVAIAIERLKEYSDE